jgi:hypothetical protein
VTLILSLLMASLATQAQLREKIPKVAVLDPTSHERPTPCLFAFQQGCATSAMWRARASSFSDVRLSNAFAAALSAPQYRIEAQRHARRLQGQHPVDVACQAIEALLNVV